MTSIANVTLNSVVYYPSARQGTLGFVWVDRTSAYPAGQGNLSMADITSRNSGNTKRVGFRLNLPAVSTTSDACACPGVLMSDLVATIYVDVDTASSLTSRTDFVARIADLVASSLFTNAVENLEGVY